MTQFDSTASACAVITQAFNELTPYSYTDGWFLTRELTPHISYIADTTITSKSVAKYLEGMEARGQVEKRPYARRAGIHQWRLKQNGEK